MSFLHSAGAGAALGDGTNSAATGLGHLLGADPSRISQIAGGIGNAANGIARAGGAEEGYQAAEPNNFLQLGDPDFLRAIMAKFGPSQPNLQTTPISYSGPSLSQLSNNMPGFAR